MVGSCLPPSCCQEVRRLVIGCGLFSRADVRAEFWGLATSQGAWSFLPVWSFRARLVVVEACSPRSCLHKSFAAVDVVKISV